MWPVVSTLRCKSKYMWLFQKRGLEFDPPPAHPFCSLNRKGKHINGLAQYRSWVRFVPSFFQFFLFFFRLFVRFFSKNFFSFISFTYVFEMDFFLILK